jgi:hypothetical protein
VLRITFALRALGRSRADRLAHAHVLEGFLPPASPWMSVSRAMVEAQVLRAGADGLLDDDGRGCAGDRGPAPPGSITKSISPEMRAATRVRGELTTKYVASVTLPCLP